jgi:hypothetical protein
MTTAEEKADEVAQLQATRQGAVKSRTSLQAAKAEALRPPDDPEKVAACDAAMADCDTIIGKCDAAIADAIVAGIDLDEMKTLTKKMEDDAAALDAAVSDLNAIKDLAGTLTDVLGVFV